MIRSGNRLLIWFLVCSFVFFVVAVIVEEFALFDSEAEVQDDGTPGGTFEQGGAADSPASAFASGAARGDYPALSSRQLRLVSTTWPPFADAPGRPRFAIDLVDVALERMGIGAQSIVMDEDRLASALLNGGFDGSAAVWADQAALGIQKAQPIQAVEAAQAVQKNEGREDEMLYSRPYLENRLILVGRRGGNVSATSLAGLAGTRVALVAGHAYAEVAERKEGPVFVRSNSDEDSVARLLDGEVDYALMDDLVVQYLVGNHGEEARTRLAFGSAPLLTRSLRLAVSRSLPDAESIISRFDAEVPAMIADRTYHGLLMLDWIRTDVDGDGLGEYVPYVNQTGPDPPDHYYELFLTGGPAVEPGMARRYYLDGDVYEGWTAVPGQYKSLDVGRPPGPHPRTVAAFNFTW